MSAQGKNNDKTGLQNTTGNPASSAVPVPGSSLQKELLGNLINGVRNYANTNALAANIHEKELLEHFLEDDKARPFDTFLDEHSEHIGRNDLAQHSLSGKDLVFDKTLSSYLNKVAISLPQGQKDLSMGKVVVNALTAHLSKIFAAISAGQVDLPNNRPPELRKNLREDLQSIIKTAPTTSLSTFQRNLTTFFSNYPVLSSTILKEVEKFRISNNTILDGLVEIGDLSDDDKKNIIQGKYTDWPPAMKKLANGLFLKQTIALYKSANEKLEEAPRSAESMMTVPRLDKFFKQFLRSQKKSVHNYAKTNLTDEKALHEEWGTPLDEGKDSKVKTIDFGAFSSEEKKALMDAMLDTCFIPNIDRHAAEFGLDADRFKTFTRDVFDLHTKELTIPTANGNPVVLRFANKDVSGYVNVENNMIPDDKVPLQFTLDPDLDQYTKEFLGNYLHVDTSKQPVVLTADHVPGLLMAFAMQNTSQLSDEDKKKSLSDQAVVGKPEEIGLKGGDVEDTVYNLAAASAKKEKAQKEGKEEIDNFEDLDEGMVLSGMDSWKDIAGSVPFKDGSMLALQCCTSNMTDGLQGGGGYGLLTISNVVYDEKEVPVSFSVTLNGVEDTINGWEDRTIKNMPFTAATFDKLKTMGQNSDIYALPASHDVENYVDYINLGVYTGPEAEKGTGLSNLSACRASGTDLLREGKKITHFGKELDDGWVMFDVKFGTDSVHIKDKAGSWDKTMSFAAFTTFIVDKGLTGYTAKEYKENIKGPNGSIPGKKYTLHMMSPASIWGGIKKWRHHAIVEGFEKNREESQEEVQEWIFETGLTETLGHLPFIGEYFKASAEHWPDTYAKRQAEIVQKGQPRIGRLGNEPIWGKETFVHHHELKGKAREHCYHKIHHLFDKSHHPEKYGAITASDRKEAAGALLYVLEKLNAPYPRNIVQYAGSNSWAKIILSPEKFKIYEDSYNKVRQKFETGPQYDKDVRQNMDTLANYEMRQLGEMMKDEEHRHFYGYETVDAVQELKDKVVSDTARKKGLETAGRHGAFKTLYEQEIVKKYQSENRFSFAIGALEGATHHIKKSNPNNYYKYVGSIMDLLLNGGLQWGTNRNDKKTIRDICRKHGLTFSEYMLDDAQGGQNMAELLELISQDIPGIQSFKEATGRTEKNVNVETWSAKLGVDKKGYDITRHKKFSQAFLKWFTNPAVASKVMPYIQMSNLDQPNNLFSILEKRKKNKTLNAKQKYVLERYTEEAVMSDITNDTDNYTDPVNDQIQFWTVMGTHKKLINMDYYTYSDGKFTPSAQQEPAQYFRRNMGMRVQMFAQQKHMARGSVEFVFKKYYSIFSDKYGDDATWLPLILARVKDLKKRLPPDQFEKQARVLINAGITQYVKNAKKTSAMPRALAGALHHFENFFLAHADKIDSDMIKSVASWPDLELSPYQISKAQEAFDSALNPAAIEQVDEFAKRLRGVGSPVSQGTYFPGLSRDATTDTKKALLNNFNTPEDEDAAASVDAAEVSNAQEQEIIDHETQMQEAADAAQKEKEEKEKEEEEERKKKEAAAQKHHGHEGGEDDHGDGHGGHDDHHH